MVYEDKSVTDLLEKVRKQTAPSVAETASNFWEDDFIDDFEMEEEAPEIELEECITSTVKALKRHRLSADDIQTMREFLTFHVQTRKVYLDEPEARRAYYNLLVHSEEKESIRYFADVLRDALKIRQSETLIITEKELLQRITGTKRSLIPNQIRFVLIDECQEAPRLNLDGNGSAREASKQAIKNYETLWKTVFSHLRSHPGMILVIGCDEDIYRSTLRPFSELSQRICSHHIYLTPQSEEDLLADCMMELKCSSFTLSDDFEPALRKYFFSVYRTSELRSREFVADLISQIYTNYYSTKRETHLLDATCIPVYDPLTQSIENILGQLDRLVGLTAVKSEFRNIYSMQVAGLADPQNTYYHMLFTGNPGTGKTTVAKMVADLFFRMGIIKTNKVVTVKPCDMVSEWVSGTGMKTMETIRRAYNGILFIDEAYGIATMDRGDELLNILMQEMENNADKLIVILAGYTDEMRELLKANPGLGSRIGQELHFDDFTQEELAQIFLQMCKKDGFSLDPSARDELDDCIAALMTREFFGNARDVRSLLQDLKEQWSNDYYELVRNNDRDSAELERVFLPQHFAKIMPPKKEVSINDLIGLDVLKKKLAVFKRQAMYQKHLREKGFTNLSDFSMHMIFTGNPGTGKTTVAKLIADDLYSIGILKTNRLTVVERKDLISVHGDSGRKTADVIRKARGGVLFIDEAYSLADNRYGNNDCIEVLLTAMEEHKADTVFIFAGYVDEMQTFLAANPGIQSRIGYTFHFEDYAPEELTKMYADKMKKMGFVVSEDALSRVFEIMEYFQDVKHFGNGRFVNHVIHQTISQRANRDFSKQYRDVDALDIPSFKTLIETAPSNMQLYDPANVTLEDQRRIAVHELGHAIVMVSTDPDNMPKSISIRNHANSYGRVTLALDSMNLTEQQLLNYIAVLLSGKNAEKVVFGDHSTGCATDYAVAKKLAGDMITQYAMVSFGNNVQKILETADQISMKILEDQKKQIEAMTETLLSQKELSGEALLKALRNK